MQCDWALFKVAAIDRKVPISPPPPLPSLGDHPDRLMVACGLKKKPKNLDIHLQTQRRHARIHERDSMQDHLRLAIAAINVANTEKQNMTKDIDKLKNENDSLREELKDLSEAHEMRMVKIEESIKDIGDEGARRLDSVQMGVEQNFQSATEQVKQNEEFQKTFLLIDNEIIRINDSAIPRLVEVYRSHEMSIRKLIVEDDKIRKLSVGIFHHFDKALKEAKNEMEMKLDQVARRHENDYEKTMEFQEAAGRELDRIDQAVEKNADELNTQTQSLLVFEDATKEQFRNVSKQMKRDYENLAEKISNEKRARQGSFQELTQEVARLKATSCISYGSFLWKIDNVDAALKMAAVDPKEAIYGQSFYSRPNGYLMREGPRAHLRVPAVAEKPQRRVAAVAVWSAGALHAGRAAGRCANSTRHSERPRAERRFRGDAKTRRRGEQRLWNLQFCQARGFAGGKLHRGRHDVCASGGVRWRPGRAAFRDDLKEMCALCFCEQC